MENVWYYFVEIGQGRTQGFNGPNPLSYQEIEAWSRLTGTPLQPREVSVIKQLDLVYMRAIS